VDFEKEITKENDCHDLYGLVVMPNAAAIQDGVLPGLADKLLMNGKPLAWDDAFNGTLGISLACAIPNVSVVQLSRYFSVDLDRIPGERL
jgi:hypothetical protein